MLRTIEKAFTVAMLFYTTGAALTFVIARVHGYSGMGASQVELLIQSAFYGVPLCFIALRWREVASAAWRAKWILALLAVTMASTAWSQDPSITLRRSLVLCATTLFGIYFATRFDPSEQLRLLAWMCALVICASILLVIFVPRFGLDQTLHAGDWQGAFNQKNMLARAMVLSVFVFFFVRFRPGNPFRWIGLTASMVLLVLSRSVTGVVVCAAILATLPLYRLFRTSFSFAAPVFLALFGVTTAGGALAYVTLPTLLQFVHRDATLTGRLELWNAVLLAISKRPWLGYGFSAFWQGLTGESANVLLTVRWLPGYAHNGFLDLVLDTGLVGLAVFVAGYLAFWRRAIALVARSSSRFALWTCAYLTFVFFYNLTEGPALSQNNISWVLYVCTAVNIALSLRAEAGTEAEPVETLEAMEQGALP